MKHTIMCSCGKLAIKCDEASKAIEDLIQIRIKETFDNLLKYNSSFPVSNERVNFEQMILKFQSTDFTELKNKCKCEEDLNGNCYHCGRDMLKKKTETFCNNQGNKVI